MTRILVTDHVFPNLEIERDVLAPLDAEIVLAPAVDEETLVALASTVQGMLVCFAPITERVVDAASVGGCSIIARYGIGYDNVDIAAATRHGIVVTNVPDYCLDEVADHTMALLLAAARGLVTAASTIANGGWDIDHARVHRIGGRTLAVIGLGGIGGRVAARARAFNLRVVAYDPYAPADAFDGIERADSVLAAVQTADFISLHAQATPANRHLIDAELIAQMERVPWIINTSRGSLVDLDAAAAALESGRIAGLALDVTEPEPLPAGHPLRTDPGAIITPHMAFHSAEATEELQRRTATEVLRVLSGEAPEHPVNRIEVSR